MMCRSPLCPLSAVECLEEGLTAVARSLARFDSTHSPVIVVSLWCCVSRSIDQMKPIKVGA